MRYSISIPLIFLATFSFAQDLAKDLRSGKWYVNGGLNKQAIVMSRQPVATKDLWEAKFLPTGRLMRCDTVYGSLFNGDGKEMKVSMVECDTTAVYQLKNDLLYIKAGKTEHQYKVKARDKELELSAVEPKQK